MFKPKVHKFYGIESAEYCTGWTVVIDVIRAFTTAAYCFDRGAQEIFLVRTADNAFALKKQNPEWLLIGESGGKKIEGFDFGNSPENVLQNDLTNKTVVLRSSSGTQGVCSAIRAEHIMLGSLVVATATVNYLKRKNTDQVSLLAMGSPKGPDKEEDLACREYLESLLVDKTLKKSTIIEQVRNSPSGRQALDQNIYWKSPGDLECAIDIDRFEFAMPVTKEGGHLIAHKVLV